MDPTQSPVDPSVCYDYSQFLHILQGFRRIDDNIIPRLNGLTTRSLHVKDECLKLRTLLETSYRERESMIRGCLGVIDGEVGRLEGQLNDLEQSARRNEGALSEVPEDQAKVQSLKNKITSERKHRDLIFRQIGVEEIIRSRTSDVLKRRCESASRR